MTQENKPKISIGMPVWNGEPFIEYALDSILSQTYKNFELIISDNGSDDETEKICRRYSAGDERIRYFRSPINKGGFINFLSVLNKSDGEYFMWAAADDCWESNWLEVLIQECLRTDSIVFGKVKQIDSSGRVISYATNDRNLTFSGSAFLRRIKFFLYPSVLGKANLIYGIYPKKILTNENLSVLGSGFKNADMLFLYQLLGEKEIRANLGTSFYKRVPNPVLYSDIIISRVQYIKNNLKRFIIGFCNIFSYYRGYFYFSNFFELFALIIIFPFAFLFDISTRVYWGINLRHKNKILKRY